MAKRVGIIGAGLSGLIACKNVVAQGFSPVVFEAENKIGGLWHHTMETTRLQTPKNAFQFSDFPWPSSITEDVPRAADVVEYLESYAKHFDLLRYIKLNKKVVSVDYEGESEEEMKSWESWGGDGKAFGSKGRWKVRVLDAIRGSSHDHEVDFLVLCIRRFSGVAHIPEVPVGSGPEVFSRKVLHSMDYAAMENEDAKELITGKKVVIIGSSKSAVDLANECALANGKEIPCTVVQRTIYWMLPDPYPWGVDLGHLLFNRFYGMLNHKPAEAFLSNFFTTLLSPVRGGISKFIESYLKWRLPLKKYGMIPKESFVQYSSACTVIMLPENFYDKVENGSIVLKKSRDFRFHKKGLILDGEDEPLTADIIIFATRYKGDEKLKSIFSRPYYRETIIVSPTSPVPLYRLMIQPHIPQLAVIGYADTLQNIFTFEVKSKWLAFFLNNAFTLPSITRMEQEIHAYGRHVSKYSINNEFRRACITDIQLWYTDHLCKDMDFYPRKKNGFLKDLFKPYSASDYHGFGAN